MLSCCGEIQCVWECTYIFILTYVSARTKNVKKKSLICKNKKSNSNNKVGIGKMYINGGLYNLQWHAWRFQYYCVDRRALGKLITYMIYNRKNKSLCIRKKSEISSIYRPSISKHIPLEVQIGSVITYCLC